jgi:hypothetical protein
MRVAEEEFMRVLRTFCFGISFAGLPGVTKKRAGIRAAVKCWGSRRLHPPAGRAIKLTPLIPFTATLLRQIVVGLVAVALKPACQSISAGGLGRAKP